VVGKVGKDVTLAEANEAARLVGLTILAVVPCRTGLARQGSCAWSRRWAW